MEECYPGSAPKTKYGRIFTPPSVSCERRSLFQMKQLIQISDRVGPCPERFRTLSRRNSGFKNPNARLFAYKTCGMVFLLIARFAFVFLGMTLECIRLCDYAGSCMELRMFKRLGRLSGFVNVPLGTSRGFGYVESASNSSQHCALSTRCTQVRKLMRTAKRWGRIELN